MLNLYYLCRYLECGHFCIKYVLKKDHIKSNVSYNGQLMSLGLVSRVLKEYYQNVNCYKVDNLEIIKSFSRCITLIKVRKKFFHYVVIEKIDNDFVFYYDPAFLFLKKVKIDKFYKKWSNYCCIFRKK